MLVEDRFSDLASSCFDWHDNNKVMIETAKKL
jgi:hypothetical protein